MLDIGRLQIERPPLPLEQGVHTRKQRLERPIELADVTEAEAAQKTAERRRLRQTVATQTLLRRIAAQKRHIVEALATRDQRLAQTEDRLRRRVAATSLLHRHPAEQIPDAEPARQ